MRSIVLAFALIFTSLVALSQGVVQLTVNGITETRPSGASIDVEVDSTGITTIRVVGTTAETDVGLVTLYGGSGDRVDVLVGTVEAEPNATFPSSPNLPLLPGARHWAGIKYSTTDLRARRVACL